MASRKLFGMTKKMLSMPDAAVVKTFRADARVEIENPRDAVSDPKLAKVRSQIVADINDDIAKAWRAAHAAGSPPRLSEHDVIWSIDADKDAKGKIDASTIRLTAASKDDIVIPGPPKAMGFRSDVAVTVDSTADAARDPKLAAARTRLLAQINDELAKAWRERHLPGSAPKLTADDVNFTLR